MNVSVYKINGTNVNYIKSGLEERWDETNTRRVFLHMSLQTERNARECELICFSGFVNKKDFTSENRVSSKYRRVKLINDKIFCTFWMPYLKLSIKLNRVLHT